MLSTAAVGGALLSEQPQSGVGAAGDAPLAESHKQPVQRKPLAPGGVRQQAWLLVYADLITVLLTFFVLLQSLSTIDPIKFDLFTKGETDARVIPYDERLRLVEEDEAVISKKRLQMLQREELRRKRVERLLKRVQADLTERGLQHLVAVESDQKATRVTLQVKSSLLFNSGEGKIRGSAALVVDKLGRMVARYRSIATTIEGHTDNRPIRTRQYASNWELSTARAVNVLKRMIAAGVAASSILATGYGDEQPVADNDSEAGRAANRRILIHLRYPQ
jgi:chemotaxis protein MotB